MLVPYNAIAEVFNRNEAFCFREVVDCLLSGETTCSANHFYCRTDGIHNMKLR